MSELREELLSAYKKGNFLQCAVDLSKKNRNQVIETLVALHNVRTVDLIEQFESLHENDSSSSLYFKLRLLEKALPSLKAPIQQVMDCIAHLVANVNPKMAGNIISSPFIEFCSADLSRSEEAMVLINESPQKWKDFILPVIIAGTRTDLELFFEEALCLSSHEDIEIRKPAIFSIGQIQYGDRQDLQKKVLDYLEKLVYDQADDHLLSNAIRSMCSICMKNDALLAQGCDLLKATLSKGGDYCLRAASELFGFYIDEFPSSLIEAIAEHLLRINPKDKNMLSNFGFGIVKLLTQDDPNYGIELLESLLLANPEDLSLKDLDDVVHGIYSSENKLTNKLLTRWFLKGDHALCEGIYAIVTAVHDQEMHLEIDIEELPCSDLIHLLFLSRKTIGYLFLKPITAASVIISLMRQASDPNTLKAVGSLLFDPLLLNFSGSLHDFLSIRASNESGQTKDVIQSALNTFDAYWEDLKSIGDIPEMHPSQDQREAQSRHFNQMMSKSYKEAEKRSILNFLCTKTVILYGKTSINYIQGLSGQSKRMEMPMKSHEMKIEYPRQEHIDPFGLDYMLRIFRVERLVKA